MIEKFIKEIEEIENSFPSRTAIMDDYVNKFKKTFVGTYDELQERMQEAMEKAKQEFYKKKNENDKLVQLKEAEMLDYLLIIVLLKTFQTEEKFLISFGKKHGEMNIPVAIMQYIQITKKKKRIFLNCINLYRESNQDIEST